MRIKLTKIILAAILAVALAFTLSCSNSDDYGDGGGGSGGNSGGNNNGGNNNGDGSVVYTDKGNSISSYKTKTIGGQTWMAENLNYKVTGSKCYGEGNSSYNASEVQANCNKYGRLYDWAAAMTVCPSGWHLPSNAEWDKLYRYADGDKGTESPYDSKTAGEYLKTTSGWSVAGSNGKDTLGFSALPGGHGDSDGDFFGVGYGSNWWSSSEINSSLAYRRYVDYNKEYAHYSYGVKSNLYSVRCMRD
jgi:uncharacterized protein (TIGR02145 family)